MNDEVESVWGDLKWTFAGLSSLTLFSYLTFDLVPERLLTLLKAWRSVSCRCSPPSEDDPDVHLCLTRLSPWTEGVTVPLLLWWEMNGALGNTSAAWDLFLSPEFLIPVQISAAWSASSSSQVGPALLDWDVSESDCSSFPDLTASVQVFKDPPPSSETELEALETFGWEIHFSSVYSCSFEPFRASLNRPTQSDFRVTHFIQIEMFTSDFTPSHSASRSGGNYRLAVRSSCCLWGDRVASSAINIFLLRSNLLKSAKTSQVVQ